MRWLLAVMLAAATPGCASMGEPAASLTLRYVEARVEGNGPTDPVWVVVEVAHAKDGPVTLEPDAFSLRDADGRSFEFFAGYVESASGARRELPVEAAPGSTYEVHLQGYLVGSAPPEPPLTVRWSHGVERASATLPWPPR